MGPKQPITCQTLSSNTSCQTAQRHITRDRQYPELLLDIQFGGAKTWYFIYRDYLGALCQRRIGDAAEISRHEARQKVDALTLEIALGQDICIHPTSSPRRQLRFSDFVEKHYLPFAKSYKRSWPADASYLRNHHLPAFGDRLLHEITREEVTFFRDQLTLKALAPGTVNRCMILLRYLFNLAIKWKIGEVTDDNPTKGVPLVPDTRRLERFLTEEETQRLIRAVAKSENPYLRDIIPLLLLTGARKREILDARWEHIIWDRRQLLVPLPKGGKPRYIPLSTQAIDLLVRVRSRQVDLFQTDPPEKGWVFSNPKTHKPFVNIFNAWDTARKRAGLQDLRMHDLRHSFASFLVNHGRSLYEVQRILGHTQIRTTQRYAHLSQDTLLEAVNMAGNLLESKHFAPKTKTEIPAGVPADKQNRDDLDLTGDTHDDDTY